jgi:hypothetical protein
MRLVESNCARLLVRRGEGAGVIGERKEGTGTRDLRVARTFLASGVQDRFSDNPTPIVAEQVEAVSSAVLTRRGDAADRRAKNANLATVGAPAPFYRTAKA